MVDKKVRGLKSFFVAVATLFDTEGRPNGSAASVHYGDRDGFKLVCNAHNWASASGRNLRVGTECNFGVISSSLNWLSLVTLPVSHFSS